MSEVSNERYGPVRLGDVCVVTEVSRATGRSTLFGVYVSEWAARLDYGGEDERYKARFDVCSICDMRPRNLSSDEVAS